VLIHCEPKKHASLVKGITLANIDQQCKNFENQRTFFRVMNKYRLACFLDTQCSTTCLFWFMLLAALTRLASSVLWSHF